MKTKDAVLQLLEAHIGESVSGEKLAETLGVTRTSIWKAIQSLRAQGISIASTTNKGYTLLEAPTQLDAVKIQQLLPLRFQSWHIETMETTSSTQQVAKDYANRGEKNAAIFISNQQTNGRGRLGRTFVSPENTGIYMSLCIFPDSSVSDFSLITCQTAVAMAKTLEQFTTDAIHIKWVNDLYKGNQKICGILTEAITDMESQQIQALIIGIGLNIYPNTALEETDGRNHIGSLFPNDAISFEKNQFVATFLNEWNTSYQELAQASFMDDYIARSNLIGKSVTVTQGGEQYPATATTITKQGHLVVQLTDGSSKELSYGEVSVRNQSS